jgi:hypothetical protein
MSGRLIYLPHQKVVTDSPNRPAPLASGALVAEAGHHGEAERSERGGGG